MEEIYMNETFFKEFLMISNFQTILYLILLGGLFALIYRMQKKKVSFSKRVLSATALGLFLGIFIQILAGFPDKPMEITAIVETTKWYSLFGNGFIDLIRMLVVPLVSISIIHVIITTEENQNFGRLVKVSLITTMSMVAVAAVVGLALGLLFDVGSNMAVVQGSSEIKAVTSIVDTLRGLIPSNPIKAMADTNIIGVVIFSAFVGMAARRMNKKYHDIIKPFNDLMAALQKIITSIAMSIIKLMPYAVIALLANTIAQRGLASILSVMQFILVLYLAVIVMFAIQMIVLSLFGISPLIYIKKAAETLLFAFTSRSSVGALPLTISTLTEKMGVNQTTANFVASFGTTAGMQGCAGVFPALLVVFVANMSQTPLDFSFLLMSILVISIGSLGIAGIPGTATMAASVALSGTGMSAAFPLISPILAIDPLIDMGRTFLNVSGSMTNALISDKILGTLNLERYQKTSHSNDDSE